MDRAGAAPGSLVPPVPETLVGTWTPPDTFFSRDFLLAGQEPKVQPGGGATAGLGGGECWGPLLPHSAPGITPLQMSQEEMPEIRQEKGTVPQLKETMTTSSDDLLREMATNCSWWQQAG